MNSKELKKRRLACADIPTDEQGNLMLPNNPKRISGTEQRKKGNCGLFYKKTHTDIPEKSLGTYRQFNFGAALLPEKQTDEKAKG